MEDWTPAPPARIDAGAFTSDIELVSLPGLAATLVLLAAGGALRGHVWPRVVTLVMAIAALALTLQRTVRFNAERLRARGRDHAWAALVSVRGYREGGTRHLVLTFEGGVVATSSRMWRFDRLAAFIGAGLHERK
jgi:hypothetical protein